MDETTNHKLQIPFQASAWEKEVIKCKKSNIVEGHISKNTLWFLHNVGHQNPILFMGIDDGSGGEPRPK